MKSKETLNKVKALLGLEINLEERSLENGTRFESEAFESGREVFIISPFPQESIYLMTECYWLYQRMV